MIFGGLEIVAGGYLLHRHYRKKNNQANTGEDEAQKKRHHTFPSTICGKQQHHQYQHHVQQTQQPHHTQHHQPTLPHQKYAYYAIAPQPRPQIYTPQTIPPPDFHQHHHPPAQPQRPQPPPHPHSFTIPRRPVPQRKPHIIIQPSLQRSDSFATLSRMPIANGSRPHDVREAEPASPSLLPHAVYGTAGYSVSTPAFGATPTSPGLRYEMATPEQVGEWERYAGGGGYVRDEEEGERMHYAPTVSTELGERDVAPPPYVP